MASKLLMSTLALGLLFSNVSASPLASGLLLDGDGNLILDTEQEAYQDLSTEQKEEEVVEDVPLEKEEPVTPPQEVLPTLPEEPLVPVEPEEPTPPAVDPEPEPEGEEDDPIQPPIIDPIPDETPVLAGEMAPQIGTYNYKSNIAIVTKSNMQIAKVEIEDDLGLTSGAWTVTGDAILFDSNKLDSSESGDYKFRVIFENDTESSYTLRVIGEQYLEDYWQQNITTFNKNPKSHVNVDLELVSNTDKLDVTQITFEGNVIPKSSYIIINGTVIIGKAFLTTLDQIDRGRLTLMYAGGITVDFPLQVIDEVDESASNDTLSCS